MKRIFSLMVMAIAILNGLSAQNPGDLDSTFNGLGHRIVTDTTYLEFEHVAVMADGRIVAAGLYNYAFAPELWVQRYMPDGSLDTSFAHTGEVILGGYTFVGEYMGMALQPDGKVVLIATVLAQGIECHRVVRLNVDGSLDAGFGNAGQVLDPINSLSMFAFRIFVQPSGRLVAATQSFNGASAIAFLPNGTRDFSYGNWSGTGNVELSVTGSLYLTDAAMQPDGKVISLTNFQENQEDYFFLTRLTANGLPDSSFGTNGVLALYDSIYGEAQFAVDANAAGEVFVSGVHPSSINLVKAAVHKFLPDGSRDLSFGQGGVGSLSLANTDLYAIDIKIASDGKPVVCGQAEGFTQRMFIGRLLADGSVDLGFGTSGVSNPPIGGFYGSGNSVAEQPDGKLVVAGFHIGMGPFEGLVARFVSGIVVGNDPAAPRNPISLHPNPSDGKVVVRSELLEAGNLRLTVVDMLGRTMAAPVEGMFAAGPWQQELDVRALPTGTYWLRAEADGQVQAIRMVVVH